MLGQQYHATGAPMDGTSPGPGHPGGVWDPNRWNSARCDTAELNLFPAQDLSKSAARWRELDEYTAKKAYLAVFGVQEVPKLMSEGLLVLWVPRTRFAFRVS